MPVFINEVVIRANVERPRGTEAQTPAQPAAGPDRAALAAEIRRAVMDYLERELDRIGER
jgi:hypothetical protein